MIIQLIYHNKEICDQWKTHFNDCNDVTIHCGDYFALKTDCVVSPANSFGFMDGGLDFQISEKIDNWSNKKRKPDSMALYWDKISAGYFQAL
jgi:hypothetical protein